MKKGSLPAIPTANGCLIRGAPTLIWLPNSWPISHTLHTLSKIKKTPPCAQWFLWLTSAFTRELQHKGLKVPKLDSELNSLAASTPKSELVSWAFHPKVPKMEIQTSSKQQTNFQHERAWPTVLPTARRPIGHLRNCDSLAFKAVQAASSWGFHSH